MMVRSSTRDNPDGSRICSGTLREMPALTDAIAVVLAHQGGWDEILMVVVPVGIFVVLLRVANRRAQEQQARGGAGKSSGKSSGTTSGRAKGPRGPI